MIDHLNQYILQREKENDPIVEEVNKELNKIIEKNTAKYPSICVACFSTRNDDSSQWSRYAKNGSGVCLGFSPKNLQNAIQGKHAEIRPVIYCDENSVYKEIDKTVRFLEEKAKSGNFLSRTMHDPIPKTATFTKYDSFSSENEYRLALYGCGYWSYKFTFRENSLVPYIELPISSECITEIILGPSASLESEEAWSLNLSIIYKGGPFPIKITRTKSGLRYY